MRAGGKIDTGAPPERAGATGLGGRAATGRGVREKARGLLAVGGVLALLGAAWPGPAGAQTQGAEAPGFLTGVIQALLSGPGREVRISGLEGALSSQARIAEITLADDGGEWLRLEGLRLDWSRLALLRRRLEVNTLTIERVSLLRRPLAPIADTPAPTTPAATTPAATTPAATGPAPPPAPALPDAAARGGWQIPGLDDLGRLADLPGPDALAARIQLPLLGSLADLPTPEAGPALRLPELPLEVQIGQLALPRIEFAAGVLGKPVRLGLEGHARLGGGEGGISLVARRSDDTAGEVSLQAGYADATGVVRLDLILREPEGGILSSLLGLPGAPALDLMLIGAGTTRDFTARLGLASNGVQRLGGTLRLTATDDPDPARKATGLRLAADLGGDVTALFLPAYRDFFGPRARLRVLGQRTAEGVLRLEALDLGSAQMRLQAAGVIRPGGVPGQLMLDMVLADPEGRPVRLPLPGAPVDLGGAILRLGYDAAAGDAGWRLQGRLDGLQQPGLGISALTLAGSGRLEAGAGMNAPDGASALRRLGGTLRLTAEGLAPADPALARALGTAVQAEGKLFWSADAPQALQLRALRLTGADYGLEASIGVGQVPGDLAFTGSATLRAADLRRFGPLAGRPDLAGAGRLTWEGSVAPVSGGFDGVLRIEGQDLAIGLPEVDGLLAGPSTASLDARRDGAGIALRAFEVRARGGLALGLSGNLSSTRTDLRGRIAFADLGVLGPGYAGAAQIEGLLARDAQGAQVDLEAEAQGLTLATGQAALDGVLRGDPRLNLSARQKGARVEVERLELRSDALRLRALGAIGMPEAATATTPEAGAQAARRWADLEGDFEAEVALEDLAALGQGWRGAAEAQLRLQGRLLAEDGLGTLSVLAQTTDLGLGDATLDTLLRGRARLELRARRTPEGLVIEEALLASPAANAIASGGWAKEAGALDVTARLVDLGMILPDIPGPLRLAGRIGQTGSMLDLDMQAEGPANLGLRIRGGLGLETGRADLQMTGRADAILASRLVAPVALRGAVSADLRLEGPLELASVSGQVRPDGLRAVVPEPPLALEGIGGTIDLAAGQARIDLRGRPQDGGQIAIRGSVGLSAPFRGSLTLTLQEAVFRDPQLYQTAASGSVVMEGPLTGGGTISGRLRLGESLLRITTTGAGGFGTLPGLQHQGATAAVRTTLRRAGLDGQTTAEVPGLARPFALDLAIEAPRRIFVRGRGLDAELGGQVRLRGTTSAVLPAGSFALVRGRLELLGRRFDLTEGGISLEGRFVPRLRFVARSQTPEGEVRIEIDGPADAPDIRFLSDPPLPDEEVVARLLFGRDLTRLSPLQAAQLASALATLTGAGGEGVLGALRRRAGLDDLDILTDETGAAGVRVGKYLTQNAYADVALNPDGTSEISLNLDLSDTVTARGKVGDAGDTSIGVFFERDY